MIRIKLGIILLITDGFSGRPVEGGLSFLMDGRELRAIRKPGGFYVFSEIPEGEHVLTIRSVQFEETVFSVTKGEGPVLVSLQPGKAYGFGGLRPVQLTLVNESKIPCVRIAQNLPRLDLKLAQPEVKAGESEARLLFEDISLNKMFPADYLLVDGDKSEIVRVEDLRKDEASLFSGEFRFPHKRGCMLYPVVNVHFRKDEGAVQSAKISLPKAEEYLVYTGEGKAPMAMDPAGERIIV